MRGSVKELSNYLLTFWLVVITDPYSSINYEQSQTYEIKRRLKKITIKVYCAEGHEDCYNKTASESESEYQEEYTEESQTSEPEAYFCYVCNPPQWIHF
jgi:hypothetical protein